MASSFFIAYFLHFFFLFLLKPNSVLFRLSSQSKRNSLLWIMYCHKNNKNNNFFFLSLLFFKLVLVLAFSYVLLLSLNTCQLHFSSLLPRILFHHQNLTVGSNISFHRFSLFYLVSQFLIHSFSFCIPSITFPYKV